MKRILGLILSIIMLMSLAACGAEPETDETQATTATTEAPTGEAATEAPTEETVEIVTAMDMDESVLVDDENCTFTVQLASTNEHLGMTLDALCVNKTDKTLLFTWNTVSVCGFMYDPLWSQEVAPGGTVNSVIYIDTYQLEQYGITSVDEITFTLCIFDSGDFMAEPYVNDVHTIYPTGLSAETYVRPERAAVGGEQVTVDNGDVSFILESFEDDGEVYTLRCYLNNKTGKSLMFAWDETTVDGCAIDPMWTCEVAAGKQAYSEITFYYSQFEENNIENVQQIDFRLTVSDLDDWEAENVLDETFTFRPEDSVVG